MSTSAPYRILGIDPGTNYMGYGVIEVSGKTLTPIVLGDIDLHKILDPYDKLRYIFERVRALIAEYSPREVALESPFFGQNVQSMLKLGRAQGVAMAAALSSNKPVAEYAPTRIKQSITGNGAASKEQVAAMLGRLLNFADMPKYLDATDALAVAYCHFLQKNIPEVSVVGKPRKTKGKSWASFLTENPDRVK
jgi:crossover junction endodeoxyribonuclease RuvC